MRRARHPVWRAASILALLLVTQLSYAAQLCRPATAFGVPAHAMDGAPAGAVPHSSAGATVDPCCPTVVPQPESCLAAPYHLGRVSIAAPPAFDPPVVHVASYRGRSALASNSEIIRFPKLAAASHHPPPRNLFCRYLI